MARSNELERLSAAAELAAARHYAAAVAAELDISDARPHWQAFSCILARAWIIAGLMGAARGSRQARMLGAVLPFDDQRIPEVSARDCFQARPTIEAALEGGEFREAVQAFDDRVPRLRSEWERLADQARRLAAAASQAESARAAEMIAVQSAAVRGALRGSFFVSDLDRRTIVKVRDLVAEAIRGLVSEDEAGKLTGLRLPEFIDAAQLAGAANLTRFRLQTVFRTNLAAAYNDGAVRQLTSPAVVDVVPLSEIDEIRDRRTRGNPTGLYPRGGFHWQVDGYVGLAEELVRRGLVPPAGYNCRASVRGVPWPEARRRGFIDAQGDVDRGAVRAWNGEREAIIARGDYPDRGFRAASAAA